MPKYELMYIISSEVSDDNIASLNQEVKTAIEKNGGMIEKFEDQGKKRLAYQIGKTKIGNYVLVDFAVPPTNLNQIEHKIRTTQGIIRHIVLNMDEALMRMEKDRALQAKLKIKPILEKEEEKPAPARRGKPEGKKIEIDLEAEIEKALESPEELK